MKKILFICPYPFQLAPSQRFRYEQYLSQMSERGYNCDIKAFLSKRTYKTLYQSGNFFSKIIEIIYSYVKRLLILLHIWEYEFVFIHREATPVGPPVVEWFIAKVFKKKIIYDFDDAIWLTDRINESLLQRTLKWRSKVSSICKWSYKVSCGNDYLASYAVRFNTTVIVNPTTIDTQTLHNPALFRVRTADKGIAIGWTGSHSTLKYLDSLAPVLQKVETQYPNVHFIVIADQPPKFKLKRLVFKKWNKETEVADLSVFDIGIMPLPDDEWAKGKCGFKALQYMAMEIPCLASPIGVNSTIIKHGINGFLCNSIDDWALYFETLILDSSLRKQMGKEGRLTVERFYSIESNSDNFFSLFE